MILTAVQDQAIAARTATAVGADTFDRLFRGVRFDELNGDVLFVYALDEYRAAELEDHFALHIAIAAENILWRKVLYVMVFASEIRQ